MDFKLDQITSEIRQRIDSFDAPVEESDVGTVTSIGDGIARIRGLGNVMATELLEFPGGVQGIALNLEPDEVGAVAASTKWLALRLEGEPASELARKPRKVGPQASARRVRGGRGRMRDPCPESSPAARAAA